jgi:hypothetical protein
MWFVNKFRLLGQIAVVGAIQLRLGGRCGTGNTVFVACGWTVLQLVCFVFAHCCIQTIVLFVFALCSILRCVVFAVQQTNKMKYED